MSGCEHAAKLLEGEKLSFSEAGERRDTVDSRVIGGEHSEESILNNEV